MSTKLVKKSGVLDFINQPFTEEKFLSLKKEYDRKGFGRFHPLGWNSKKPKSNF